MRIGLLCSKPLQFLALLAPLCLLSPLAWAYRGGIEPIEPRQYYQTLKREIDHARSSITVCVYLFGLSHSHPDSRVEKLASSLAAARRRGVSVEVLLDLNLDFTEGFAWSMQAKNMSAFEYLKANGIAVAFDGPGRITHSKVAVIDGETVILGSGNWTEASFGENMETNVLLRSKDAAREILNQLSSIPRRVPPEKAEEIVEIPLQFLTGKEALGLADFNKSGALLDVYALLLRKQRESGGSEFSIDFDEAAKSIGVARSTFHLHRRRIQRALNKLKDPAGLVQILERSGKGARVRMKPLAGEAVPVPVNFWTWGWNRRLSKPEMELYILGLHYSRAFSTRPQWSRSVESLAKELHYWEPTISFAVTALRRANLFEVRYDENPLNPEDDRAPSIYLTNPLYDPAELESALRKLEEIHGPDRLKRARTWASLVYDDSNLGGIEDLIESEYRWGGERIKRAAAIMELKSPSNPKRNLGYFLAVIANPAN